MLKFLRPMTRAKGGRRHRRSGLRLMKGQAEITETWTLAVPLVNVPPTVTTHASDRATNPALGTPFTLPAVLPQQLELRARQPLFDVANQGADP